MASTNFKIFNEANASADTYNDSEYDQATQRKKGVMPGMALSRMHNKMFYQWSTMSKAIADAIVNAGYDCNDYDVEAITAALEKMLAQGGTDAVTPIIDGTTPAKRATEADHAALADIAKILQTARTIALTGAVTGSAAFDGSKNISIATTSATQKIALTGAVTGSANFNGSTVTINTTAATPTGIVGTVQWYAGHNLPSNHLLCDGSAVSRTTFAGLFAVIGTTYGAGNGSTTFNLPNLIGRFAEGATSPGSYISAGLPNIWGAFAAARRGDKEGSYVAQGAFAEGGRFSAEIGAGGGDDWGSYYDFNANRSNGIYGASGTVQPPALTLKPIIRYA